jgi:aminoglycoside phosphotransferase (APT) family kinase protein
MNESANIQHRWKSAVETLAKFHNVNYEDPKVDLSSFGRHSNFYDRQIKTFSTLAPHQGKTKDKDTGVPVGDIPHFEEVLEFFKNKKRQPKDRSTLIHGDYKIDNMVFHKTEPRVIGILDWEMATIGHPLSDVVNLTSPWGTSADNDNPHPLAAKATNDPFKDGVTPGLPTLETVIRWYTEFSGYDVAKDLAWGNAFGTFRTSVIMQGIAARYAARQASGITAKSYAAQMRPFGEFSYRRVQELKAQQDEDSSGKAKL